MSRDIRSFFLPKGKKSESSSEEKSIDKKKNKKRVIIIDSDSDDDKNPSPKRQKKSSLIAQKTKESKPVDNLKPVNVAEVFGSNKVKRTAPPPTATTKLNLAKFEEIHSDDDFEATLGQIDELEAAYYQNKTSENRDKKSTTLERREETEQKSHSSEGQKESHTPKKRKKETHSKQKADELEITRKKTSQKDKAEASTNKKSLAEVREERASVKKRTPEKIKTEDTASTNKKSPAEARAEERASVKKTIPEKVKTEDTASTNKKEARGEERAPVKKKTPEKIKTENLVVKKERSSESRAESPACTTEQISPKVNTAPDTVASPADPAEKKRQNVIHYMKYLQREGPKHLGSKEIPKGKPGCFSGLVFVITGVLDSLERDDAVKLIEQYGGKVTSNVSRNTSYVVYGQEPGPKKMEKADSLGTPQIDEDGLLNLITSKSQHKGSAEVKKTESKKHKPEISANGDSESLAKKAKLDNELKSEDTKNDINKSQKEELCRNSSSSMNLDDGKSNVTTNKAVNSTKSEPIPEKSPGRSKEDLAQNSLLWVDKYRPTKTKQIIGQQGDRSAMKKLMIWLQNWQRNNSGNKVHVKPSPWAKNDDGAFFKAGLLSGPPGIGKTTMAHLVSQELGFDVVEFNASDTRSKKLLHQEISELLSSKSLFGYCHGTETKGTSTKHVLLMDEVDGMAGNEDRGGVQELIQLIKNTRIPIICMCNDRNHPKIRSLANYCFDLRVMKPRLEQIRGAMMSVCFREGLKISADALSEIISGANFDMRQILHNLSLWSANEKELSQEAAKKEAGESQKDMKLGPWDIIKKVFSAEDHKTMSINDKSDLFFHDYSIIPLFVQENYLSVVPAAAKGNVVKSLNCIASAADSISLGDLVDKSIRTRSAWSLLPVQAVFSSVIPGDIMEGYFKSQINFPTWLGKNSRTGKLDRLLQELHVHTRMTTSGSKQAINLEYLPHIRDAILRPLKEEGAAGVPASLDVLRTYSLLREDLDSILELTQWPNEKDPMASIESKVKAALTRAYNKEGVLTPYSVVNVVKKRSAGGSQELDYDNEEGVDEEDEDKDDVTVDAMIKAKKPPAKREAEPKTSRGRGKGNEASARGSKGRGRGRGK